MMTSPISESQFRRYKNLSFSFGILLLSFGGALCAYITFHYSMPVRERPISSQSVDRREDEQTVLAVLTLVLQITGSSTFTTYACDLASMDRSCLPHDGRNDLPGVLLRRWVDHYVSSYLFHADIGDRCIFRLRRCPFQDTRRVTARRRNIC